MTYEFFSDIDKSSFAGGIHAFPLHGHSTNFQLVDDFADDNPPVQLFSSGHGLHRLKVSSGLMLALRGLSHGAVRN
ncbi:MULTISPECIES: hypothetical protein [Pseudomonas]|uniref:Uncharacterized protein n=1 Tax=Pseudomonas hunanensis TaxID=1247546 RepID=A0ACC6K0H1_9PSED|nr:MULTISPECIES: hypothetical protein [Pseudomonas]MBP2264439.1 hypothetical protein [Pseudomonas sp. BP8]MDR6711872.1 hypothetical protein [Pseudomonas hunanensis]HDS1738129.1 hypothetical protein [Pseudomonas putida]